MKIAEIINQSSMPIASPSYPKGPYRFINREYLIVTYESDPNDIREALPEPLMPDGSNQVHYEFIKMPDSSGFGAYVESGIVIPCLLNGESVNFTAQMYLDNEPPISAGREIWGFPKKFAHPTLSINHDTLTGVLVYGEITVAIATMGYKHENLIYDLHGQKHCSTDAITKKFSKTQINLKIIPGVDGKAEIAQLVGYQLTDINVKGAWSGPARLHLVPHVNAPVADLPVKKVIGGIHFTADITLPYGKVLHDYLK